MKKIVSTLPIWFLLFIWAFQGHSAVITAVVTDGNWKDPNSWDLLRLPQAGDYIIIPAGRKITLGAGDTINLCGDGNCANSSHPTYVRIAAATVAGQAGGILFFDGNGQNKPLLKLDELSGILIEEYSSIDNPKINENGDGLMDSNNNSINTFIEIANKRAWGKNQNSCNASSYPSCVDEAIYGGPTSIGFTTFMPIRLLYFRVDQAEDALMASWATGQEKNNDHFSVEASWDGLYFQEVARVNSQGDASSVQYYATSLPTNLSEQQSMYFRLKQTDHDGQFTYSHAVLVQKGLQHERVVLFPNPATQGQCYLTNPDLDIEAVSLFDLSGRMWLEIPMEQCTNQSQIWIPIGQLPKGTYCVMIRQNNRLTHQKLQIGW